MKRWVGRFGILLLTLLSAPLLADSLFRTLYTVLQLVHTVRRPTRSEPVSTLYPLSSASTRRLAVVIAAHDEAGVIGETVAQIRRSHYPADHLAVFVIADNCQDATAQVARVAGACVWDRRIAAPRGKGAALDWFLQAAARDLAAYDALVILDADTRLDPDALAHLAAALDQAPVVQGFIQPMHADGATVAGLAAYSEILSQAVDDVARARLGWPVPLRGTGMALPPRLLADLSPRLRTRIEDTELTLLLAERGIPIAFAADARIGDPKPGDAALAARQRARWLQGRLELLRLYWPLMLRLLTTGRLGDAALILTLALRPKTLALAVKVGLGMGVGLLALLADQSGVEALAATTQAASISLSQPKPAKASSPPADARPLPLIAASLLAAASIDLAYYPIGLALIDQPRPYARVLLRAPAYSLVWLRGLWTALTTRDAWLSVRRQRPASRQDLQD